MTTGRARTMAAHLSRLRIRHATGSQWRLHIAGASLSSGPACCWPPLTYALTVTGFPCGQGHLPLLQGGCSTGSVGRTCLHKREQNGCCLGIQAALAFPPSVTAMAGTTSPKSEPACITMQALLFPAHSHFHCTNRWSFADRLTLAAYCARPLQHLKPADASLLEELGFQLPELRLSATPTLIKASPSV